MKTTNDSYLKQTKRAFTLSRFSRYKFNRNYKINPAKSFITFQNTISRLAKMYFTEDEKQQIKTLDLKIETSTIEIKKNIVLRKINTLLLTYSSFLSRNIKRISLNKHYSNIKKLLQNSDNLSIKHNFLLNESLYLNYCLLRRVA